MFFFFRVETSFIVFVDLENPSKVTKITVLGLIVQVLLQPKVGATPELRLKFRDVQAGGGILPIIVVSGRINCLEIHFMPKLHHKSSPGFNSLFQFSHRFNDEDSLLDVETPRHDAGFIAMILVQFYQPCSIMDKIESDSAKNLSFSL